MGLRVVAGIATKGRAPVVQRTVAELARQTRRLDEIFVCASEVSDVGGLSGMGRPPRLLFSAAGSSTQRNAIIDAAGEADILIFFDDDFVAHPDYVGAVERHFEAATDLVVATGRVLADGIGGPGLSAEQALEIIGQQRTPGHGISETFSGYGCNMAVRLAPVRAHGIRFDERLALYAWQEDVDLSRRLARHGRIVRLEAAMGVHLGVKTGRSSGLRLGYAQVINPLYLWGKGEGYPLGRALTHIARNVAMNLARAPRPEPYVDRRGRLRGNALALRDLISGRMAPERVSEL